MQYIWKGCCLVFLARHLQSHTQGFRSVPWFLHLGCIFARSGVSLSVLMHTIPSSLIQWFPLVHKIHCQELLSLLTPKSILRVEAIATRPTVFSPRSSNSWYCRDQGASFPPTISIANMIPVLPQQTVWYSFPNGPGFGGTSMNPGQVCMFVHVDIDSSKHTMCPGLKLFCMFSFHASIISLTSWKRSG